MHSHDFKVYQIDKGKNKFSKIGYFYSKCSCGMLAGSPIKDSQELKELEKELYDR